MLTPSHTDKNRLAQLKKKDSDPTSFGSAHDFDIQSQIAAMAISEAAKNNNEDANPENKDDK